MGDTVALPHGHVEVEERPGYLFIVEHGRLQSVADVEQYGAALELISARTGTRRAMIDSRLAGHDERTPEVQEAMWRWLAAGRAFDQVACVLESEMAVVRVNMVARAQRAGICAFAAVHEAHRWLTGRQRTLSQSFTVPLGGAATPVPPPRAAAEGRDTRGSSGPASSERPSTGRFLAQTRGAPPIDAPRTEAARREPSGRAEPHHSDVAPRESVARDDVAREPARRERRRTRVDET